MFSAKSNGYKSFRFEFSKRMQSIMSNVMHLQMPDFCFHFSIKDVKLRTLLNKFYHLFVLLLIILINDLFILFTS